MVKTYSDPSYILFSGGKDPQPTQICAPVGPISLRQCVCSVYATISGNVIGHLGPIGSFLVGFSHVRLIANQHYASSTQSSAA